MIQSLHANLPSCCLRCHMESDDPLVSKRTRRHKVLPICRERVSTCNKLKDLSRKNRSSTSVRLVKRVRLGIPDICNEAEPCTTVNATLNPGLVHARRPLLIWSLKNLSKIGVGRVAGVRLRSN